MLTRLNNTAIITFEDSNIVLAKYRGGFYFFEKNLKPVMGNVYCRKVVTGYDNARLPTSGFVETILLKVYQANGTKLVTKYDAVKSHHNQYYTILSDDDYSNMFRNEMPSFPFIPVFVEYVRMEKVWDIMQAAKLKMAQITTLDDTPVLQDVKEAFSNFAIQIAKSIEKFLRGRDENPIDIDNKKELLKDELLNCETKRAGLEAYKETILTSPNLGHWDLYEMPEKDRYGFIARNPKEDINNEGVIGIDFGTKSTVVYFLDSNHEILPVPIGDINTSFDSVKRYENPTVLQFVSLTDFKAAYDAKPGRPKTLWTDLWASHKAQSEYDMSESRYYNSFLSQLKQWASGRKTIRVRAKKENGIVELKPFLNLKDGDINPIEYYAYYIGLYINNMRNTNSIYFDYYLSFPVTCEEKVKEKIRESFERGLKKSLPPSLLKDSETMESFKVRCHVSEPMAYAVCALQEFGLDEPTNYAVFDFGGGTTDFDYGTWNLGRGRYDYEIESFGGEGISTTGGENILEDLAFEIFRDNISVLSEDGKYYPFWFGPTSKRFVGGETFCVESLESDKNMHTLVEKIRPFWEFSSIFLEDSNNRENENSEEEINNLPPDCEKNQDDESKFDITLSLFDNSGEEKPGIKLTYSKEKIKSFITGKIKTAVDNFFTALNKWNGKFNRNGNVCIFLAGNSSKSPYVKQIFEEKINELGGGFTLYYPLGTEKAVEQIKERVPDYVYDNKKPTTKSGVAFGLISCRNGGKIKVVKPKAQAEQFLFYIGNERRRKFELLYTINTDNRKPEIGKWYQLFEADGNEFYIFYTDKASCLEGNLPVTEVKSKKCRIQDSEVDDSKFIWIRAVTPHTIEYAVADSEEHITDKNSKQKVELG